MTDTIISTDGKAITQLVETAKAFLLAMAAEADEEVIYTGPPPYLCQAQRYGAILDHLAATITQSDPAVAKS